MAAFDIPEGFRLEDPPAFDIPEGFRLEEPSAPPTAPTVTPPILDVAEPAADAGTGFTDYASEIAQGIAQGAITTTGTALKGVGAMGLVAPNALEDVATGLHDRKNMSKLEWRQWKSKAAHSLNNSQFVHNALNKLERGTWTPEKAESYLREKVGPHLDTRAPQETAAFQKGEEISQWAQKKFKASKPFEESWTRKIAEGGGSTVPFLVAAFTGPLALPLGSVMGETMSSGEAVERAIQKGASREDVITAAKLGLMPGVTEQIPLEVLFDRIPLPVVGRFSGILKKIVGQAATEGGQEAVQQVMQNMIAKYTYDPKQGLSDDVLESAIVGAAVGGIMGAPAAGVEAVRGPPEVVTEGKADRIGAELPAPDVIYQPGPEQDIRTAEIKQPKGTVTAAGRPISPVEVSTAAQQPPLGAEPPMKADIDAQVAAERDQDNRTLLAADYTQDMIDDMDILERADAVEQALDQGVQPLPPGFVLDEPAAEPGTRQAPVEVETAQDVEVAAAQAEEPTPAQAEAENYKQGHVKLHGLDLSIETPKGVERKGVDEDGKAWKNVSPAHYGKIKGTKGADGDALDIYIGDNPSSNKIFVVDQNDLTTGKFDETKTIFGVNSEQEARDIYENGFSDGRGAERIGAINETTADKFNQWVKQGDTQGPFSPTAPRPDVSPAIPDVEADIGQLPQPEQKGIPELRGARDKGARKPDDVSRISEADRKARAEAEQRAQAGPEKPKPGIPAEQPLLEDKARAGAAPEPSDRVPGAEKDVVAVGRPSRAREDDAALPPVHEEPVSGVRPDEAAEPTDIKGLKPEPAKEPEPTAPAPPEVEAAPEPSAAEILPQFFGPPENDAAKLATLKSAKEGRRYDDEPLRGGRDWMINEGLAERDGKSKRLKLTPKGEKLLADLERPAPKPTLEPETIIQADELKEAPPEEPSPVTFAPSEGIGEAAPEPSKPLEEINVKVDVEIEGEVETAKVEMNAADAIKRIDRRINGLHALQRCVTS